MKKLIVEEAYVAPEEYPWDMRVHRQFHLDAEDIAVLEEGETLFRGDIAFSLEEEEESL